MTVIFADTSAVIKRYITEIGSNQVSTWIEPEAGNVIIVSELATVEVFSALARHQREGTIRAEAAWLLQGDFLHHVEAEYLVVMVDSALLHQSRDLINKHPVRTLDAIQLACALQARAVLGEPFTFASADRRLLEVADAEGFTAVNPETPAS